MLLYDTGEHGEATALGAPWRLVTDRVMGGVSTGDLERVTLDGHPALQMTGKVRLENDGGFVQMNADLDPKAGALDLSGHGMIRLWVYGDGERYDLRLKTTDLARPWQSYRAAFSAPARWTEVEVPLSALERHRTEAPLDPSRARRLALVAIGRAFSPRLAVRRIELE